MGVMGRCVEEEKEKGVCGLRGDVSLTEAATRIIFVTTKHVFVATKRLSRQKWYLWQLPPVIVSDLAILHSASSATALSLYGSKACSSKELCYLLG